MAGGAAIFAGIGALSGIGDALEHQNRLSETKDLMYQQNLMKMNAEKEINSAKEQDEERYAESQRQGRMKNDPMGQELLRKQQNSDVGNIALSPITDTVTQPQAQQSVPGAPPEQTAMPQPKTMALPAQQANNASPQPEQAPMEPPANVPMNSPAGQAVIQQKSQTVSNDLSQGANPTDVYINALKSTDPATAAKFSQWRVSLGADTPEKLNQLKDAYAEDLATGKNNFTDNAIKLSASWQKMAESTTSGSINPESWGDHDKSTLSLMNTDGIRPTQQPLRPLSRSEQTAIEGKGGLLETANASRDNALNGINTLNSVFGITDVPGGPGTIALAKFKTIFDNLTDTQISKGLDDTFLLHKDAIIQAGQNIKNIGGKMNVGQGILKMEAGAAPSEALPAEARRAIATQLYATHLATLNRADAINDAALPGVTERQIHQYVNNYSDSNPVLSTDGTSFNSSFMGYKDYKEARINGTYNPGLTQGQVNQAGPKSTLGQPKSDVKIPMTKGDDGTVKFDFSGF